MLIKAITSETSDWNMRAMKHWLVFLLGDIGGGEDFLGAFLEILPLPVKSTLFATTSKFLPCMRRGLYIWKFDQPTEHLDTFNSRNAISPDPLVQHINFLSLADARS